MTRIEASGLVSAPRERVFAFLSALENHWTVAGRWIEVVALDEAPAGATGGRVRIHGPLGLRRTAVTRVDVVEPPSRLRGTAQLGRTTARVSWDLSAAGAGLTEVRLAAEVTCARRVDRLILALGGAAWMRRLFATTIAQLAARYPDAPIEAAAVVSSARA